MFGRKIFPQTHSNKAGNGFENSQRRLVTVFLITVDSKHFRDMTSGTKLKKMIKEHVWKKKFFLKRIRISQETDLKIPKALSNRVFDNGYSKHFRDMTSGTKLKKMIKEHVWKKKFFLKRIRIRQGNGFENSKGA